MQISNIKIDEYGAITCTHGDNELYLQLPDSPDSRHYINGEPLTDADYIKALQTELDNHFGKGDRTLARLCYAGGQVYNSYIITDNGNTFITDNGDTFVEHPVSDYYNVELYIKADDEY